MDREKEKKGVDNNPLDMALSLDLTDTQRETCVTSANNSPLFDKKISWML